MTEEKITARDVALGVVEARPPDMAGIVTKLLYGLATWRDSEDPLLRFRDEIREEFPFLTIEEANQVLGALYKDEALEDMLLPDDCDSVKECENLIGMCRCFTAPING